MPCPVADPTDGEHHRHFDEHADHRHQCGTRFSAKEGNGRVRQSLYMPALSAKRHDPYVKAYFEHLLARGKKKLQALCAVMRKLLHAIHGMLKHQQPFDNTRFYAMRS